MTKLDQINQTKHRSFTFDTRIDVRSMATILMFFRKKQIPITSKAGAGRLAIEWFCEIIISQNPELEVLDPAEALEILKICGITPAKRSRKPLMKHLTAASLSMDTGINPDTLIADRQTSIDKNSQIIRAVQAKISQTDTKQAALEKEAFTKQMEGE